MLHLEGLYCIFLGYELVKLPGWIAFSIIVLITSLISLSGLIIRRKYFATSDLTATNSRLATTILSIIGGLTAFTISFVVVNSWIKYQEQVTRMENEAIEISNFYKDCFAYPKDISEEFQKYLMRYTNDLVTYSWPQLVDGNECIECGNDINNIYSLLVSYNPANEIEKVASTKNFEHIHKLTLFRRLREMDSQNPIIPQIIWQVIFAGFFLAMITTYFININNIRIQIILTIIYSLAFSLLIFVGLQLNYPYRGVIKVEPFALLKLKEEGFPLYSKIFIGNEKKE